jgi:CRISPR/Cas system-associated exonuclease Cas4 (RecB family)
MSLGQVTFVLFLIAGFCLFIARRLRRQSGLPIGEIIYEDTIAENARILSSHRHGFRGKPDYLLDDGAGGIIPVELKSSSLPRSGRPHRSHVMQLAVYFVLVEDDLRRPARYGLIRYRNGEVPVENTDELRQQLLSIAKEIRRAARADVQRSHEEVTRCRVCSMAHVCDERL